MGDSDRGRWDSLPPFTDADHLNVVIETPRGSRNKYKFDPEFGVFRLDKVLPIGMSFPYDFGYVPGTLAEDGDPLDVLLLVDEPVFSGCLLSARPIGILEAVQQGSGSSKEERNDRLIAVAGVSREREGLMTLADLPTGVTKQVAAFFSFYHRQAGGRFKVIRERGPKHALELVERAVRRSKKSSKSEKG